jgi:hypothetical protein
MFNVYGAPDLDIALDKGEIEYWVLNKVTPSFQYSSRRIDTVGFRFSDSFQRVKEGELNMDEKEESCCTINYQHHKEIFENRRQAFLKDPEKAMTTHQAKIRLIQDHYKEAKVPGGYTIACDEPPERGGTGKGPAPLQYLVASVGL